MRKFGMQNCTLQKKKGKNIMMNHSSKLNDYIILADASYQNTPSP